MSFQALPQMCKNILNLKFSIRVLPQKRTIEKSLTFIPLMRKRNNIFVFFLFAIFNFWRRKFDRDPGLSLPLKSNSEVSKMFTRFEFI